MLADRCCNPCAPNLAPSNYLDAFCADTERRIPHDASAGQILHSEHRPRQRNRTAVSSILSVQLEKGRPHAWSTSPPAHAVSQLLARVVSTGGLRSAPRGATRSRMSAGPSTLSRRLLRAVLTSTDLRRPRRRSFHPCRLTLGWRGAECMRMTGRNTSAWKRRPGRVCPCSSTFSR